MKELRRERLKALLNGPRFNGDRAAFCTAADITNGRLTQLLDPDQPFGDVAERNLREDLNLPDDFFTRNGVFIGQSTSLIPGMAFGQPVAVFDDGDVLSDDYIQIKEFDIRFSAGNGRTPVFDELTDSVVATFRRDWFHRMGINPARAIRVKVHGNSMYPLLHDGDSVVVNLAETNIINDKVYALRYGDELRIKRLYRKLDGGLILHSDNPDFIPRDEEVPPSIVESSISIVGRVRDKSGSGGLD